MASDLPRARECHGAYRLLGIIATPCPHDKPQCYDPEFCDSASWDENNFSPVLHCSFRMWIMDFRGLLGTCGQWLVVGVVAVRVPAAPARFPTPGRCGLLARTGDPTSSARGTRSMTDAHRTERSADEDLLPRTRSPQGTFALSPACGFYRISLPFRDTQARSPAFRVFLEDPTTCCGRLL
jgi:hypothetical protein